MGGLSKVGESGRGMKRAWHGGFRQSWALAAACLALQAGPAGAVEDAAPAIDGAAVVERLEPEIARAMVEGQIPSLTLALVSDRSVLYTGAWGYSNLWAHTPAVPGTVYLIGSTFKTLSTAALLQLEEQGKFDLDDPVNRYLDEITIRGEDATRPVTFRHLLSHVSGMPAAFGPHEVWGDTVPPPLQDYLQNELRVEQPPEQAVVYSNMAFALVAQLVERLSGTPYERYVQEKIFAPLGMTSTVFEPTPEIEERLAVPYVVDAQSGRPVATARLKADVWPAGIVYGTAQDLGHWLMAVLAGGSYGGQRLLEEATVAATLNRQYDRFAGPMHSDWGGDTAGYGLTWWTSRKQGERHFAHSGSVPGFTAFMEGNADRRVGIVILSNGHRVHPQLMRLADLAIRLMSESAATVEETRP